MDLNSNAAQHQSHPTYDVTQVVDGTSKLTPYQSCYFNVSNYKYNIITNRQKSDNVSMPKLVDAQMKANKMKTFLHYWNNENFFDPVRNSKSRFETPKVVLAKRRSEFDLTKYASKTPLPVIKVLNANRIQGPR